MKTKLIESEKSEKLLNNPILKKKLYTPELKKTNLDAQRALQQIPNVKRDDVSDLLDWMEKYLLILKK